jgi:arsenite methyltransferase
VKLAAADFEAIDIEPTRVYSAAEASEFLRSASLDTDSIAPRIEGKFNECFHTSPEAQSQQIAADSQ